ncbi:hemolysin E-like [Dysidea avara]|uniref:hemolysin E-like n=1 Tax=Dysidea avara TaxID=196820 RepID=UPI003330D27A
MNISGGTAEAMIELFSKGLDVYLKVKEQMERALGLNEYAKKLQHINQVMDGVRKFLSENEKDIADVLIKAHKLTRAGMQKAVVVVQVIKSQCQTLADVLTTDVDLKDKMFAACTYFATFAKDMEEKVDEAETKLVEASNELFSAKLKIKNIISALKKIQDGIVLDAKEAISKQRAIAYGSAAVGLIMGPIGLVISYGIAASITEGITVKGIEENFEKQRKIIEKYITDFTQMKTETETLQTSLDKMRKELTDIHGKLSALASLSKTPFDNIKSIAKLHFGSVLQSVRNVIDASEKFLTSFGLLD